MENFDIDFNFDSDMFSDEGNKPSQFARVKRYRRPKTVNYKYAKELVKGIGHIEEGEHIDAIVSGSFIAGDFIEAYIFDNNLIVDELIIATLSMSSKNVDSLKNIQQFRLGDDGRIGLIVSDFFFSHERKDGIEDIITQLGDGDFVLAVAGAHTKIALIKTKCGKHIVVGGSANLRSSLNIEQITVDNCKILYSFHRKWMAKILNDYQVTHKFLRREKLWKMIQEA